MNDHNQTTTIHSEYIFCLEWIEIVHWRQAVERRITKKRKKQSHQRRKLVHIA